MVKKHNLIVQLAAPDNNLRHIFGPFGRGIIAQIPIKTHYGDEESHLKPIEYGMDVLKIILKNARGGYDF